MSSTVGSLTSTGWKRRASAASFSMCLRYSSSVVAPTQCSSPRASAGFSMLEASIAPSALPAPTSVCSSSMNRMISPWRRMDLGQHGLEPLLELAAELGAGDHGAEIERQQLLVAQGFRHVAVDDALRQPFDDRGLADAGLADQDRVVLGAARQHLDRAADLLVAADDGVELAFARHRGQVARIFLQRFIAVLGGGALGLAALAHRFDRRVQVLRRQAGFAKNPRGRRALGQRQGEQQPFCGDEAVAGLGRDLLGRLEQARRFGRQEQLAGAAALDPRLFAELAVDALQGAAPDRRRPAASDWPQGLPCRPAEP